MKQFDADTFEQLGISFENTEDAASLAEQLMEELEVRIGERIARGKSRALLDEFDNAEDDMAAVAWLKKHQPDYREIVEDVTADMRRELLIYRAQLPGTKLHRDLEQDETPVEDIGLAPLIGEDIRTAGALVASLDRLPPSLDRRDITRTVNRLWAHLTARPFPAPPEQTDETETRGMEVLHPVYGRGTVLTLLPSETCPMMEVVFADGIRTLSQAWVGAHCKVQPVRKSPAA